MNEKTRDFIIFISIIVAIAVFVVLSNVLYPDDEDKACIEKGFNRATDSKYAYNLGCEGSVQIECDYGPIIRGYQERNCTRLDKWGDCINECVITITS